MKSKDKDPDALAEKAYADWAAQHGFGYEVESLLQLVAEINKAIASRRSP